MNTHCCVVGGGPAGMMLGLLLAREGIEVAVLEKHQDFLRDFRGDTIHPSTLELLHELGLLEEFLKLPHQEVRDLGAQIGDVYAPIVDFTHLPTQCKFIALMPQWDFLNFLAAEAAHYPTFHLHVKTEVKELIREGDRIVGVRAQTPEGPLEVRADLVVGADGRHSTVRENAGLEVIDLGAPMDVLWMRIPRQTTDPDQSLGRIVKGRFLVMINRQDYWQCAFLIRKGTLSSWQERGIDRLREELAIVAPFLRGRLGELRDWDQVRLLTVTVDRLRCWHKPGLLCIGDSAHAMSPIGGVGINLAIQDAVATANLIAPRLKKGCRDECYLAEVQRRRQWPTRATQTLQVFVQNHIVSQVLGNERPFPLPLPLKLLTWFPFLRRLPARILGLGIRPEHVRPLPTL